jgi:predicted lipoprotein with Yx(FWY)xxD motif
VRPRSRRPATVLLACIGLPFTLSACGGGVTQLSTPPTTDVSLTLTLQRSPAGPILATGGGRTLYDFVPDSPRHSACNGDPCVLQWPPLLASGSLRVGKGVNISLVGTLRRGDGTTQLSFGGHPLYTYNSDVTPGMVMGQGINQDGGLWFVLNPRGRQVTTPFTVTGNLNGNGNGNGNG